MKTKKLLSLLLAMTMIFSMMSFPANAAEGHCNDEANCLVCEVAGLINALPAAEDITVDNAATVTNQIHAIDRIKFDLTDEQYDELLKLVEEGTDESGQGLGVPVRYTEAVKAINELGGGGWFAVSKKFTADGNVDVTDAEVQIKVTNVDTEVATALTLATLGTQTSALGADYYTENTDGWTYKYMLPTGTYRIEEVSDGGATVDGEEFVTTSTSFNGEEVDSIEIEIVDGETTNVTINNSVDTETIGHSHPVCGDANCTEHSDSLEWQVFDGSVTNLTSGNWYLADDVTMTETLYIGYQASNCNVKLCLNGHKLSVPKIEIYQYYMINYSDVYKTEDYRRNTLNLCDCNGDNGTFNFTANDSGLWVLDESGENTITGGIITGAADTCIHIDGCLTGSSTPGTLNMYGGTIVGNSGSSYGGGIYVKPYGGTLNMYGGRVVGNKGTFGGGLNVNNKATANIYGGMIDHNTAEYGGGLSLETVGDSSTINISNAKIEYNTATKDGGGIHIDGENAVVNIGDNTSISYNTAKYQGGGIYAEDIKSVNINSDTSVIGYNNAEDGAGIALIQSYYNGSVLNMNSGKIINNTTSSGGNGGGVYLETEDTDKTPATCNIKSADALIEGNTATYGGGIYLGADSNLNITGGKVQKNTATSNGGGIFAGNGFALSGNTVITDNTVSNEANNVYGVDSSNLITVGTLEEASSIGIYAPSSLTAGTSVQFTSGGAEYIGFFSSDVIGNILLEKTSDDISLQLRMLDVNERTITVADNIENGSVSADKTIAHGGDTVTVTATANENYVIDTVTVTKSDGLTVDVDVDAEDETKFTFTMPADNVTVSATFKDKTYAVNISSSFVGGTVTADVTEAKLGDVVTLTAAPVLGYSFDSLVVTDKDGNEIEASEAATLFAVDAPTTLTFTMPASEVTVDAVFTKKTIANLFTVNAVVDETVTTDKRDTTEGMDVYAGDTVKVDVVVNGADYTNADWTLVYDYSKFAFDHYEVNKAYATTGYITHDETNSDKGVIIGYARGVAGETAGDEFANGEYIVSYYFTAIPQLNEVTGKFNITSAHVNNYEMAGIQDNTAATSGEVDVTIILITDDDGDDTKTPAGSITPAEKQYNALEQSGNEYVLDEEFADATVTYAANIDGSAVVDDDGDGDLTDEIAALTYKTGLPTWKNVGEYTYYVKISGDGLATIYDSTTLTITPATLTPSATFAVDPAVDKVTIIPELAGVLDSTHSGEVVVTYTDKDGNEQTVTLNAKDDFTYDGESTSVYTGAAIEVEAQESGTFTVTLDYTEGENDNYKGDTNTAEVDVDKVTADEATIKALEDAIESVFPYDSKEHGVKVTDITSVTPGEWRVESITNAYDDSADPTVTNVGDEELAKVVFVDDSGVYNDVVVYVVLKVTPAQVRITIADHEKAVGEDDPIPFNYTLEVIKVAEDGTETVEKTNELYSEEDLTALALELVRTPGETAGTYPITASYVPNANYEIEVIDGTLTIGAPSTEGDDADVKIEVVDLSKGNKNGDETPDYIADKRLILVYTNLDKVYYGYGDATNYEKMFDVTAAGYKYVDNNYYDMTFKEDATEYAHVYGIVVDKIEDYDNTEAHEKKYRDNVIFLGSDAEDAPENIVYDADINLTKELDVNDYSMNNGIYNVAYDRVSYIKSILKADYNHDKVVDTTDSLAVKDVVDTAKVAKD